MNAENVKIFIKTFKKEETIHLKIQKKKCFYHL
jgi:hypothetical protein